MKTLLLFAGLLATCLAGHAETYFWTGSADDAWTNRLNWVLDSGATATTTPGRYFLDSSGKVIEGQTGDTAVFDGARLTGEARKLNLRGLQSIKSVVFRGNLPELTLGSSSSSSYQQLNLEPSGSVTCESSLASMQTIYQLGIAGAGGSVTLEQFAPDTRLVVGKVVRARSTSGAAGTLFVRGTGPVSINGQPTFECVSALALQGDGTVSLAATAGKSRFARLEMLPDAECTAARSLEVSTEFTPVGDAWPWVTNLVFRHSGRIAGTGSIGWTHTLLAAAATLDGYATPGCLFVEANATADLDVPVRPASYAKSDWKANDFAVKGDGTVRFNAANEQTGSLRIFNGATCVVGRLGAAGETDIPSGPVVFESDWTAAYSGKAVTSRTVLDAPHGTLAYGGEATEVSRALVISNGFTEIEAVATFAHQGASALTIKSDVTLQEAASATFALRSEKAPLAFAGSFESGKTWTLRAEGPQTITLAAAQPNVARAEVVGTLAMPDGSYLPSAKTVLKGGTLRYTAADCTAGTIEAAANTASAIDAPAGSTLRLNGLPTLGDGATIDLPAESRATVIVSGIAAGALPLGIRIGGYRCKADDTGRLSACTVTWSKINTTSTGYWKTKSYWKENRYPTPEDTVLINLKSASSKSYLVVLDDQAVTRAKPEGMTDVRLGRPRDGVTATLKFTTTYEIVDGAVFDIEDGGILTLEGDKKRLSWNTDAASVIVHTGGVVQITKGTNTLYGSCGYAMKGGDVSVSGSGILDLASDRMTFGPGTTSIKSGGKLVAQDGGTALEAVAESADDMATLVFEGTEPCVLSSSGSVVRAGRAGAQGVGIVNFNLTDGKTLTAAGANALDGWAIGCGGAGILNVSRGTLTWGGAKAFFKVATEADEAALAAASGQSVVGIVNQTGGVVAGTNFIIGASGSASSENAYRGLYNLAGGTCAPDTGLAVIGYGTAAEGILDQTGGTFAYADKTRPLVLGFAGGTGAYVCGGGTAAATNVYVGGMKNLSGAADTRCGTLASSGELCVTGGAFAVVQDVVVGEDGAGVLTVGGSGAFSCRKINLAGGSRATLRIAPFGATCNWTCHAATLAIVSGAKLEIDAREMSTGVPDLICMMTADAISGTFAKADVSFVYDESSRARAARFAGYELLYEYDGKKGLWLKLPKAGAMAVVE